MALWRIHPVADPRDPRWQGRCIWKEVVVRAPTAAMARVIASELEKDPAATRVGNESLGFRSGFEDEKLYWVVWVGRFQAAVLGGENGRIGVVRATLLSHGSRCGLHTQCAGSAPVPVLPESPIYRSQAA